MFQETCICAEDVPQSVVKDALFFFFSFYFIFSPKFAPVSPPWKPAR